MLRDLFGNEHPAKGVIGTPAVMVDLFTAAAETRALKSGRPKSQERAEIVAPQTAGAGYRCLRDHRLERIRGGGLRCPECDRQ